MRVRYLLAAGVAAGAALLAISPAAAMQPYPPTQPLLTATPSTIVAGETVVVTGVGWQPNEDVLLTTDVAPLAAPQVGVDEATQEQVAMVPVAHTVPLASAAKPVEVVVTADDEGSFTTTLTLYKPGRVTITGTGLSSGLTASTVVTVLPDKHALPVTGNDVWRLVRIGGGGVALGGLLLLTALVWRARRDRVEEAA